MNKLVSPSVRQATGILGRDHLYYRIVGFGQPPDEPFYRHGFWHETLKSSSILPEGVREVIKKLEKGGVEIGEIMIAHEAPKLLGCQVQKKAQKAPQQAEKLDVHFDVSGALETILEASVMVLGVIGIIAINVLLNDPKVIVVIDGTWVEIAKWRE